MTIKKFFGFEPPQQNWSRLPHALIDQLPEMSGAELKVVLYILRHTWGYQDSAKRITVDEFVNGRKRSDDTRIDGGCGLSSVTSVRSALKDAEDHGYIIVETDDSDQARIKKFYSLNIAQNPDDQKLIPTPTTPKPDDQKMITDDQKLIIGGSKNDHRTEKETLERNLGKEAPPAESEKETPAIPGKPYADAYLPKQEHSQKRAAMIALNAELDPKIRVPLVEPIAAYVGMTALIDADDVALMNVHRSAIKIHAMGATIDDLRRWWHTWKEDYRSNRPTLAQFEKFVSEQIEKSAPPPTTLQPQRRTVARGGSYAWS